MTNPFFCICSLKNRGGGLMNHLFSLSFFACCRDHHRHRLSCFAHFLCLTSCPSSSCPSSPPFILLRSLSLLAVVPIIVVPIIATVYLVSLTFFAYLFRSLSLLAIKTIVVCLVRRFFAQFLFFARVPSSFLRSLSLFVFDSSPATPQQWPVVL